VTVRPATGGAAVEEEDHLVTLPVGGFWLPRLAPGAEVRAAIGDVSNGSFSPVTVARVLTSDDDPAFEPPGTPADPSLEAEARSAAGL
jgi:hypothetical protein